MRYYLIAGEASGDLHASHLIRALRATDPQAEFRGLGGDLMRASGATLVRHYRDLAYMGFIPVLLHARTILRGLSETKRDIAAWRPTVVILVDYPGFNLKIARYVHANLRVPVYYYIAPKLWAWKEYRIRQLRRDVDELFSILPFETDFFERRHHYPIHYVGNPTVDEVTAFLHGHPQEERRPVIALLPGSRRQEIADNLRRMAEAARGLVGEYQLVVAGAPGIEADYYNHYAQGLPLSVVYNETYPLLHTATAALVTSGTATLEAALLRCPQVVCYYMKAGRLASLARRIVLKIPYISLVNLVAGREVVPELVAHQMTSAAVRRHLLTILPQGARRADMLAGYDEMARRLGPAGAPQRAAEAIVALLNKKHSEG